MKKILLVLFILSFHYSFSQSYLNGNDYSHLAYTPSFDTLLDRYGTKWALEDLVIKDSITSGGNGQKAVYQLCTSGYFKLFFESGSGMELSTPIEVNRRNTICKVFLDISQMIQSPLTGTGQYVNVLIKDINTALPAGTTICGPGGSILGLASSYFPIPVGTSGSCITDNLVWQTINSGTDAYTNLTNPVLASNGGATVGNYYHVYIAFNFVPACSIPWWPDASWTGFPLPAATTSQIDLYSTALHELTHSLGFASLVGPTGASLFSSYGSYYSRYDLHLQTSTGVPLITTAQPPCPAYNNFYTAPSSAVQPNPTYFCNPPSVVTNPPCDYTNCPTAIKYVSTLNPGQPVYTPNKYEFGSSLSHFEDMCANTGNTYTPNNNNYFVMSNSAGSNPNKRYLKEEERNVLCDLGYKLTGSYGSTNVANSSHTYTGGSCGGNQVVGINDGIVASAYTYVGTFGTGTVSINVLGVNGILTNDYDPANSPSFHPTGYKCLEDLTDPSTNPTPSFGSSGTISLNAATATVSGTHLLRYIPYDNITGVYGNVTYIYVYLIPTSCLATPSCSNMVPNGSFESSPLPIACATIDNTPYNPLDCWVNTSQSADVYNDAVTIPCSAFPTNINPTQVFSPFLFQTTLWQTNPNTLTNHNYIGIGWHYVSNASYYIESYSTVLFSPLIPGQQYMLRLKAKLGNSHYAVNYTSAILRVMGNPTPLTANSGAFVLTNFTSWTDIVHRIDVPNSSPASTSGQTYWNSFNIPFTCTSSTNLNSIVLICDNQQTAASYGNFGGDAYIYIDDVSIEPISSAITFSLPSNASCYTIAIPDLSAYLSTSIPGGVFSGAGVSVSGGIYSYNPITAGAGLHIISYSYTDINGCQHTISDNIWGGTSACSVAFTNSAGGIETQLCIGNPSSLTASVTGGSGSFSFSWATPCGVFLSPPTNTATSSTINYANSTVPCNYTVTVTDNVTLCTFSVPYTSTSFGVLVFSSATSTSSLPSTLTGVNILVTAGTTLTVNSNFTLNNCNVLLGANAIIDVQSGYTLDINTNSHLHGCNYIWDGIHAFLPNSKIKVSNSTIEDAKNAINVDNDGSYEITASVLNKNLVHLNINHCTAMYNRFINSSTLSCSASLLPANPAMTPFPTKTIQAIRVNNSSSILIGDASAASMRNYFSGCYTGIYSNAADVIAYNNQFNGIGQTWSNPFGYNGLGNAIYAQSTGGATNFLYVGSNTIALARNFFNNCDTAVYVKYQNASIYRNTIMNCTRGVTLRTMYYRWANVNKNYIYMPEVGVKVIYSMMAYPPNKPTQIIIQEDTIIQNGGYCLMPNVSPSPPIKKPCNSKVAIWDIEQVNIPHAILVDKNLITNPDKGVYLQTSSAVIISNNNVQLPTVIGAAPAGFMYSSGLQGIQADGSTNIKTNCNYVHIQNTATHYGLPRKGIYFEASNNSTFDNNTLQRMERGIESNISTANALTYLNTNIDNCKIGWMRNNSSHPGNQGNSSFFNNNNWIGTYTTANPKVATWNTHGKEYIFMKPSAPVSKQIIPTLHAQYLFGSASTPDFWGQIYTTTSTPSIPPLPTCTPPLTPNGNPCNNCLTAPPYVIDPDYARMIAQDSVEYGDWADGQHWAEVMQLLQAMNNGDVPHDDGGVLDDFFNNNQNTPLQQFIDVQHSITESIENDTVLTETTLDQARSMLSDIQPLCNQDLYYKTALTIWLNTFGKAVDSLSSEDIESINYIASLCPYEYGEGVYIARGIVATYDESDYLDSFICGDQYSYRLAHPTPKALSKQVEQLKSDWILYPNPTDNVINIKLPESSQILTIRITNTLGEVVFLKQCNDAINKCTFDVSNLSAGLYNCEVRNAIKIYAAKRFVIKK